MGSEVSGFQPWAAADVYSRVILCSMCAVPFLKVRGELSCVFAVEYIYEISCLGNIYKGAHHTVSTY